MSPYLNDLRELHEDDAEWMAALHAQCFAEPQRWPAHALRGLLAQPTTRAIARVVDNKAIGFIMVCMVAGESEILTLAIHPDERRKGHATFLINTFIEAQCRNGLEKMFLEVIETNTPALNLYTSLGFTIISKRPNYYAMPAGHEKKYMDALVLSKRL